MCRDIYLFELATPKELQRAPGLQGAQGSATGVPEQAWEAAEAGAPRVKAFGFEIRTEGVNSRSQVDAFLGIECIVDMASCFVSNFLVPTRMG